MSRLMQVISALLLSLSFTADQSVAFSPLAAVHQRQLPTRTLKYPTHRPFPKSTTSLNVVQDLSVIGLVAGQENYGLAVVCVGEALYSFVQAPSLSHAKILIPAAIAAVVLGVVSGPMITSGDVGSVGTGLWIATAVSIGLGLSYVARLLAPFSPSPKEIAALGLLVAIAGFFSFAQNLVVDGFISFPSLPSLPSFELPEINFDLDALSNVVPDSATSTTTTPVPTTESIPEPSSFEVPLPEASSL